MQKSIRASLQRKLLTSISAVAMLSPASVAFAQDEASVDEVIVTVERRAQDLQDFAGTAGVFDTEALKELNLTKMSDLDGALPGLNIANNGGNIEVWIRGVGNSNNTELGNPSAATHVDGVYVPRPAGFGSAFFDIERVEVNFGPQGTLRGRQSMAGSVDVIAWKPGIGTTDGMLELSHGKNNERTAEGVLNLGINDMSAARFAFHKSQSDPLYINKGPSRADLGVTSDGPDPKDGANGQDNLSYRFSYLIEPSSDLAITFTHDKIREDGTGYTGSNFANPLGNGIDPDSIDNPREVVLRLADEPVLDVDHEGTKIEINYSDEFGDLELLASRREMVYDYRAATPMSPYYDGVLGNLAPDVQPATTLFGQSTQTRPTFEVYDNQSFFNSVSESDSDVVELRFISGDGASFGLPINYTLGSFFFKEEQRSFLGATGDRVNGNWLGQEFNTRTESESVAVYFDGTYDLADDMRLTAGFRHTDEEIERYGVNGVFSIALGGCQNAHYCADSIAGNADGTNRPAGFDHNASMWGDVGTARFGTSGFEFSKFNRTIYNPDTNGDGTLTGNERVVWMNDGIAKWGENDNLDEVFAAGVELAGGWWNNLDQAVLDANPTLGRCVDSDTTVSLNEAGTELIDIGCVDGAIAGLNYDIYSYAAPYGHIALQNGRIENEFDDWRIRFEYDVNPDWLTYATVATGHKSGGFNDNLAGTEAPASAGRSGTAPVAFDATTQAPKYDSESVIYYEIGSKQEFEYGSTVVKLNLAGFYYDYQDMVVSTLTSVGSILALNGYDLGTIITGTGDTGNFGGDTADNPSLNQVVTYNFNAAEAEIMGLNVELGLDFENGLNLDLSGVFMSSELSTDEDVNDSRYEEREDVVLSNGQTESLIQAKYVSIDGHELPRAPEVQLRANLSRSENLGDYGAFDWILSAGYRSEMFMTIFNGRIYDGDVAEERLDETVGDYWTFDAGAGWSPANNGDFRLEAYVNNITNEIQPQAIILTQRDNTRFFNRERTFGVRARVTF